MIVAIAEYLPSHRMWWGNLKAGCDSFPMVMAATESLWLCCLEMLLLEPESQCSQAMWIIWIIEAHALYNRVYTLYSNTLIE